MKRTLLNAILYTLVTGVALGIGYPLVGLAHVLFPRAGLREA